MVIPSGATLSLLFGVLGTSGTTSIQSGGTMNIIDPSVLPGYLADIYLSAGTLSNAGTVNWTGTGNLGLENGPTIHNLAGGIFNDACDAGGHYIGVGGGGVFTNDGTYNKSSATGGITYPERVLFNNNAQVNINSGVLNLLDGANAGTMNTAAGATLSFDTTNGTSSTGFYTLNAGSTFSGAGNVLVRGDDLYLDAASSVAVLDLESGQLTVNAPLTVTKAFTLGGGTLSGPGGITLAKTGTLTITEATTPTINSGTTLTLLGKTFWEGNGSWNNSGTINNAAGGVFTVQGNEALSGSGTFNNGGTFTTTGSGTTSIGGTFNDAYNAVAGTVNVKYDTLKFHRRGWPDHGQHARCRQVARVRQINPCRCAGLHRVWPRYHDWWGGHRHPERPERHHHQPGRFDHQPGSLQHLGRGVLCHCRRLQQPGQADAGAGDIRSHADGQRQLQQRFIRRADH